MIAMPGLLRGVARTAVIAGTATAVSNRVSRRQAGRWAQQDALAAQAAPPAPPAPNGDTGSKLTQLRELDDLRRRGVLTDAEFAAQKDLVLRA
jgi:hypothetical protein